MCVIYIYTHIYRLLGKIINKCCFHYFNMYLDFSAVFGLSTLSHPLPFLVSETMVFGHQSSTIALLYEI